MTQLLNQAFQEASKLPQLEQNMLARLLLDEMSAADQWDELFADSENVLENLADEALKSHLDGKTKPLTIGLA
jgi:hypothetical protein